jgi:hypothetical protein
LLLVLRGTPAAVDEELDTVLRGIGRCLAQRSEKGRVEVAYARDIVIEYRGAIGHGAFCLAIRRGVLGLMEGACP